MWFVCFFISLLCVSCFLDTHDNRQVSEKRKFKNISVSSDLKVYRIEVFDSEFGGFGYQVFQGEKLIVNQPIIPVINGMKGFDSMKDAVRVADYVVYKLESSVFPPALSKSELDSLGVL